MHPKIRSFLGKRAAILKVSGQAARFSGDTIEIVGIDFIYRLKVPGVSIVPSIFINIQDLTSVLSILGEIEEAKRVDRRLLLRQSFIQAEIPVMEGDVSTTVSQITEGDTILFPDDFYESLVSLSKIFSLAMIYFPRKDRVIVHDEGARFLAVIETEVPEDVIGSYGTCSSSTIFIDSFSPSWQVIPSTWHIVLGQHGEREDFYFIFSSMKAIELEQFAPLANLLDELLSEERIAIKTEPKLFSASSFPITDVIFRNKDIIISSDSFSLTFEGALSSPIEATILSSSWQDLIPKAKGYRLFYLPGRKFLCAESDRFKIFLPA